MRRRRRLLPVGRRNGVRDVPPAPSREALASIGIDLDEVRRRVEEAFGPGALERTRAGGGFRRS